MPHIDDFWDDIVDEGLVDPDQAGRARARFIQVGGGLDTAVLESAQLDAPERLRLLEIAARALGRPVADAAALSDPDVDAARHIPRALVDRYGVMPARDGRGRLVLITPPLAPHVFNELKARLGRSFDARLALEIDLRLAIARHFDVPLPSRFDTLRSGRRPGRSALAGVPARRPAARPPDRRVALAPTPAPSPPAEPVGVPNGPAQRAWLNDASARLRTARTREALFALLAEAGGSALDGRFYLLAAGPAHLRCIGGAGLPRGRGPMVALHTDSRLDHALRIGSSRLEDWSHDPDLSALYTLLGRARPARVMIEPIRDGLEIVGVFVGDHGRAGIDRGVVGTFRRWLSRVSTRLADLRDPSGAVPASGEETIPVPEAPPAAAAPDDVPFTDARGAPPPPPRVAPPPPAAPAGVPAADPFAPPGFGRRRPRRAADLHDLAEAARTAEATADPVPVTDDLGPPPLAEPPPLREPPPPPPRVEPADAGVVLPDAETEELPFGLDEEDPLAGFLSDPEIEAVAEAIAADEPTDEPADPPPEPGEMGAPPNTLPSRPRAIAGEGAARVPSLFASVTPETGPPPPTGNPGTTRPARPEVIDGPDPGVPPPTRPQRPAARDAAPDRPGPTLNLRGPEAGEPGAPRPEPSVEALMAEARALARRPASGGPSPLAGPLAPASVHARATVDLGGSLPPVDEADETAETDELDAGPLGAPARKTVNLRPAEPAANGVEVADADVLDARDASSAPPAGRAPLDLDALAEADTAELPIALDEAEGIAPPLHGDDPSSAPPPAVDPEATTVEAPAVPDDPPPPPRSGPDPMAMTAELPEPWALLDAGDAVAGTDGAGDSVEAGGAPAPDEVPSESPAPAEVPSESPAPAEVPSESPAPAEVPSESPAPAEVPSAPPVEVPSESPAPAEVPSESPAPAEVPPEPSAPPEVPSEPSAPPIDVPSEPSAPPIDVPSEPSPPPEVPSAPPPEVPSAPPPEVPSAPPADVPSAPPAEPPPSDAPARVEVPSDWSGGGIDLDALLDDDDDDLSDLRLSPPPAPVASPTFEAIDALDLDGAVDDGLDLDLDLGLEPPDTPVARAMKMRSSAPPIAAPEDEPEDEILPIAAPIPAVAVPDPAAMAAAVEALCGGDAAAAEEAEAALLDGGEAALDALFDVFPGPLLVDRYTTAETVPVFEHGPVLRLICHIGAAAGPRLAARCEHLAPDVRYYAVFAFSAVRDPASVAAIAPALTDKDATVRAIAARVAETYRGEGVFGALVSHLVSIVERGRLADRRVAAEALGGLHTADGAPALIAMLGAPQPPLRDAAHKALVEIARQDFGHDVWRWRTFFERSAQRPRVEWLLDGLLSDQRAIRVGAFRELRRVTHQNYGYLPDAPAAARRAAAERWMKWWHQTGRAQFGHYR